MSSKKDEGISVKEIEEFAKKNKFPVAIALGVFLACLFSILLMMTKLSIVILAAGALAGIFIPGKVSFAAKKLYSFIVKQEKTTQIVIGIVFLILAIFFPPAIFLLMGLHAGKDIRHLMMEEAHPL
jgi:uncharacterized membrane protein